MHALAPGKVKWDLMVAVLIVYSTLIVPFRIGFDQTASELGAVVDVLVDVVFAIDIVASFRTAFVDEVPGVSGFFIYPRGSTRLGHCVLRGRPPRQEPTVKEKFDKKGKRGEGTRERRELTFTREVEVSPRPAWSTYLLDRWTTTSYRTTQYILIPSINPRSFGHPQDSLLT